MADLEPYFTKPDGSLDIEEAERVFKNPMNQYQANKALATLEEHNRRLKEEEKQ